MKAVVQDLYYGLSAKIISERQTAAGKIRCMRDGYRLSTGFLLTLEMLFRTERPPFSMIWRNPHNPTGRCWSAQSWNSYLR